VIRSSSKVRFKIDKAFSHISIYINRCFGLENVIKHLHFTRDNKKYFKSNLSPDKNYVMIFNDSLSHVQYLMCR